MVYDIFSTMNTEKLALQNLDREEQSERKRFTDRKLGGTALADRKERIRKRYQKLADDGWGGVHNEQKLYHVAESEEYYLEREKSEKGPNVKNAEVLETLTNYGIARLGWLGDTLKDGRWDFRATSTSTRRFDDWRHKIDSVATIVLGPMLCGKYPDAGNQIEIGIDATTWKEDERLPRAVAKKEATEYFAEKISRSNNEKDNYQQLAPFGFSQLDFYTNPVKNKETGGHDKRKIDLIPRFVIGINGEMADSIRQYDFIFNSERKKYEPKSVEIINDDPRTVTTQFKVISEINRQAEMMIKMMPRSYKNRPEFVLAKEKLKVVRDLTNGALRKSALLTIDAMQKRGMLPADVMSEISQSDDAGRVTILEQLFRDPNRRDSDFHYDATYNGIMTAADSFMNGAESDPDRGGLRVAQTRNKAVMYEDGGVRKITRWTN